MRFFVEFFEFFRVFRTPTVLSTFLPLVRSYISLWLAERPYQDPICLTYPSGWHTYNPITFDMLVLYLAITITLLHKGLLVCYSYIYIEQLLNTYSIFIYTCTEAAIPYNIGASIALYSRVMSLYGLNRGVGGVQTTDKRKTRHKTQDKTDLLILILILLLLLLDKM
jgi:hypothetical protein